MPDPDSAPRVASIVYRPRDIAEPKPPDRFVRVALDRARLLECQGIEGDAIGGAGDRHLNVMISESLAQLAEDGFRTGPGEMGEQIVLAGIDPEVLTQGVRLRLGSAVIEIGIPRTGCARFDMIQGKPKQSAKGRLGFMAKVVTSGEVAFGDAVEVVSS